MTEAGVVDNPEPASGSNSTGPAGENLEARLERFLAPWLRVRGSFAAVTLAGEASTRRYHRVITGTEPPSLVVMELPPSDRGGDVPMFPFVNTQRYLEAGDYPVPLLHLVDLEAGFLALEDLGDRTFEQVVKAASPTERLAWYEDAVALIVRLQELGRTRTESIPGVPCLGFSRRFDRALLRWELDHFVEWFLGALRGIKLPPQDASLVDGAFAWIAETLAGGPEVLVHRDFQSRNLMVPPDGQLRVIDFQDLMQGSRAYDLVALLRDSYVELPQEDVDLLVARYLALTGYPAEGFRALFALQTLQRKLKDAGRFVFIDRVRHNPAFLRWIPTSLKHVRAALDELAPREPRVAALGECLGRHVPELA